jgi:creatinine amidohydrolase/Fe(II)-dependent formamide hydrolase-like protein
MAHGVMSDLVVASAAKGEQLFSILFERLVALCREYREIVPPRYCEFRSHCQ